MYLTIAKFLAVEAGCKVKIPFVKFTAHRVSMLVDNRL